MLKKPELPYALVGWKVGVREGYVFAEAAPEVAAVVAAAGAGFALPPGRLVVIVGQR